MGSTVTLPTWLVVLAGILAFAGLFDRLLNPAVRWYLRSRANRVLAEVSARLKISIRPFQQVKRQALIDRLVACGELEGPDYQHYNIAYLDVVGVRGVSLFYLAMKRALDVLMLQPRTDPERVAMTGLSGGGWQTAVLSALDERITLTVPVAGHSGMQPRLHAFGDLGDLEQVPSDFLTVGDYIHMTALFAPRPALLIYNQHDNCCFLPENALPATYDPVVPVYQLYGRASVFQYYINENPGTHNYEQDNRLRFYKFINDYFVDPERRVDEELPCDGELHTEEEMDVGLPDYNPSFA